MTSSVFSMKIFYRLFLKITKHEYDQFLFGVEMKKAPGLPTNVTVPSPG